MDFYIETPRLGLRPFLITDAGSFFEMNADPEVIRYTGDAPFKHVAEAADFIASYDAYSRTGMGRWAVIEKESEQFVGFCGLKKHAHGEVDLGYRMMRQVWGKGYATESSQACMRHAFENLQLESLIGQVAKANAASIRVLEKCGFTRESERLCGDFPGWVYRLHRANPSR